jgi:hypothetical protein
MNMVLKIEIKNVYGNERIYPRNGIAETFAQIANTRTLSREILSKVQTLGFTVEVVQVVL